MDTESVSPGGISPRQNSLFAFAVAGPEKSPNFSFISGPSALLALSFADVSVLPFNTDLSSHAILHATGLSSILFISSRLLKSKINEFSCAKTKVADAANTESKMILLMAIFVLLTLIMPTKVSIRIQTACIEAK